MPRGTKVGDSINLGMGRFGTVEWVGTSSSSRCRDPLMPMRAAIALRPQLAEVPSKAPD